MGTNHWAIGIDLGGSKIEAALLNSSGRLLDRLRVHTESQQGYHAILRRVAETIHQLCSQNRNIIPLIIGIGGAGQISSSSGTAADLISVAGSWKGCLSCWAELKKVQSNPH